MKFALILLVGSCALAEGPGAAVTVCEGGVQPQVAVDTEGKVHVVMLKDGNVVVSSSTDRGKTFGAPTVAIDANGAAQGGAQRGPRIGVDGKNGVYVTAPVPLEGDKPDLWLVVSRDDGKTWSKPLRVNDAPGKQTECLHQLSVSPEGDVHVAWIDGRSIGGSANCLAYARVTAGTSAERNLLLVGPVCECCAPGISVDAKGNPVVVYREGGDKKERQICAMTSKDGGETFGKPFQVNQGNCKVHS